MDPLSIYHNEHIGFELIPLVYQFLGDPEFIYYCITLSLKEPVSVDAKGKVSQLILQTNSYRSFLLLFFLTTLYRNQPKRLSLFFEERETKSLS